MKSAKPPAKKTAPQRKQPGEVRIIGGLWKRTKLPVPDWPGLRPTPDRVRETLFNWLGQDLTGWHCVDAFAGTGALGLEAASRGAASVLLCEQAAALVLRLQALQERLGADSVTVVRGDGITRLKQLAAASVHLVFLDPPFDAGLEAAALQAAERALRSDGFIYLEAGRSWPEDELAAHGLVGFRAGKAGMVHAHLLKKIAAA